MHANIYHVLIHSSDKHLGWFHILATINNTAMNIRVHVSFWISWVFFFQISGSGTAGSYGDSNLVIWEPSVRFSMVAASIYIPTNSVQGFPFLHILTDIY